jgi:predicted enzyme related to lactoylglutathione lyase
MLNFNSVLIGSTQPKELAAFYEKVFQKAPGFTEGDYSGWQVGSAFFMIGSHTDLQGPAREPQRVLLNFETAEVKEEFDRIKSVGATVAKEPYEMGGGWIATLADPDGNYFQLMTPLGPPP